MLGMHDFAGRSDIESALCTLMGLKLYLLSQVLTRPLSPPGQPFGGLAQ